MKPTMWTSTDTESRPVRISVRGEQYFDGADPDTTELLTDGLLCSTAEGLRLSYEETALTGMAGTTTSFELRGRKVILTRAGTIQSQMIFEEGRKHSSIYETAYGDMSIDVHTSELSRNLTPQGGQLTIRYAICVQQVATGKSCFVITFREK